MDISPVKTRARRYAGWYLGVILFVIAFGLGILAGQTIYIKRQISNESGNIEISKVLNLNRSLNHSDSVDFNQFWEVWDRVKAKYVKQPVKDADLFYGAIEGLVYGLSDPYSAYFPPQAASEFARSLSGELEGIGAEVGMKNNQLVIVSPLPGTPAEKAGLRPGDKILAIDKIDTYGMDVTTAVEKIRGKAGSSVTLTITRDGITKARDFTIVREKINVPAVMLSWKNDIAYVRVLQFNENTTSEFDRAVRQIKNRNAKGVVLDLRSNPGGYLDAAVEMASEWITEGVVVSEKSSTGALNNEYTNGGHRLAGIKTMVLVNGGSASASEIVAGALQDHKAATLIGEKTFGKGSVQDFETFSDGSALKLTVAEWLTPDGKNINEAGIVPDIEVKEDWDKEAVGEDVVLDKALKMF